MEGNKLDLTGKPSNDLPASYKPIPETDMEEEAVTRPKSLVKSPPSRLEADGADEKMLPKEEKVAPNSDINISDVKITEKQNGDAKLDIGDVKSAFVGLTKEELMKYAKDPFWVRLRMFLFISFWLLWFAMLAGAIILIYAAPRCDPPPPKTWWEEGPLTESKHDIKPEELASLKQKGIKGIIITWPEDTYTPFNETHHFFTLLQKAKNEDIKIIIELEPGTSMVWFNESEGGDPILSDYYIWKQAKSDSNGAPEPPNNWLTIQNTSSWIYSEKRKEFYYSPTGRPHLNFRNPSVVEEFTKVIKNFLKQGAGGIRLKGVSNLLVDPTFENELIRKAPGFLHTDYGFYTHTKTEDLPDLAPLIKQWRTIVKNETDNGPFMATEDLSYIEAYRVNSSLVLDLPLESHVFTKTNLNASTIVKGLNSIFDVDKIEWPLWKYNNTGVLDIITFLLPGVPLVSENTPLNSDLLQIRKQASIMRGIFNYYEVANKTVFAFIRVASGNPGYLVALNPTEQRIVVDFPSEVEKVSEEVTVQLFSSNYNETDIGINLKHDAHEIPISPKSAIVLSYVPKEK